VIDVLKFLKLPIDGVELNTIWCLDDIGMINDGAASYRHLFGESDMTGKDMCEWCFAWEGFFMMGGGGRRQFDC